VFEAVVRACMDAGLVKGEGFAVDASVIEADASRYHGKAPGEIDWSAPEHQTRAVAEFLTALDDEGADADRKPPEVISPVDPCSAWTAKEYRIKSANEEHERIVRESELTKAIRLAFSRAFPRLAGENRALNSPPTQCDGRVAQRMSAE
jgi:hypothetical protein